MNTVLVVAPHPDDEVLGAGGTILRHLDRGDPTHVVLCTRGQESRFGREQVDRVQREARDAAAFLGITRLHALDLPAARLDTLPGADIHAALGAVIQAVKPDIVYAPHVGDVHRDHQLIFQSVMVCCRPNGGHAPRRILVYETVSETDWFAAPTTPAFVPNVFIDVADYFDRKLQAFAMYASQVRPYPHPRSIEALKALSMTRGAAAGLTHAEAFMLAREIETS